MPPGLPSHAPPPFLLTIPETANSAIDKCGRWRQGKALASRFSARPMLPTPHPEIDIQWNTGTMGEWNRLLEAVPRTTLPQTMAYAAAMSRCEHLLPRLGIIRAEGRPVAIVQVLERRLLGVLRLARIERGPLWLDPTPKPELQEAVFSALRRQFPPGLTRWNRILPELAAETACDRGTLLERCGFRKVGVGYRTIWLDLRPTPEQLRAGLAANWRNHLGAAERGPLVVEQDSEGRSLPWLVTRTLADQKLRGYRGPSGPLVIRLRNALYKQGDVLLLRAFARRENDEREPVAGILVLRHQRSATWLIGWSGPEGRQTQAHTLLVWQAVLRLRALGVHWFDLGGINPDHAPGLTTFKRGLRGEEVELAGSFV